MKEAKKSQILSSEVGFLVQLKEIVAKLILFNFYFESILKNL